MRTMAFVTRFYELLSVAYKLVYRLSVRVLSVKGTAVKVIGLI